MRICCVLAVITSLMVPLAAQNQASAAPRTAVPCRPMPPLPAMAEQAAKDIFVTSLVERLRTLVASCDQSSAVTIEEIALRQQITEAVTVAGLDVDAVIAQIDYERAQILEERDLLADARDRKINILNVANIVTSGVSGIVTNAMQFSEKTALAGDGIGVGGGAAGLILSVIGLRVQGPKASVGTSPNMLAPLLHPSSGHDVYPNDVWSFLNASPAPDGHVDTSWRDALVNDWVKEKRIGPPQQAPSQKKIEMISSEIAPHKTYSIDVLTDRTLMLLDLRNRVALMNHELSHLLRSVSGLPPEN